MGATKETILGTTLTNKILTAETVGEIVKTACTDLDDATDLPTAAAQYVGQAYMIKGVHYRCEDKGSGVYEWETYDTSGQNLNYADASNKPTLDGITLNGVMTKATLGIAPDTAERTEQTTIPSGMFLLLDDDKKIDYDSLENVLYANFDIANLPKYEKQFNPLLTSNGSNVKWEFTHTCKTSEPSVELYDSNGNKQNETTLTGLTISHVPSKTLSIAWNTASNVAANSYYVVLIG